MTSANHSGAVQSGPSRLQQWSSARYPSSQPKLGPAPFASFDQDVGVGEGAPAATPALPPVPSTPPHNSSTPTTPHIAISTATTPSSNSSDSEHELFHEKLFKIESEDLRSSTEDIAREEIPERKESNGLLSPREEMLRRASQPMLCRRRGSQSPEYEYTRKWSMGERPKSSCSSASAWRSHSPFSTINYYSAGPPKFLLETSFCGSKPIPTPSMDVGDDELEEVSEAPPAAALPPLESRSSPKSSWHWKGVNSIAEAKGRVSISTSSSSGEDLRVTTAAVVNHQEAVLQDPESPPTQKTVLPFVPPPPQQFADQHNCSSSSSSSSLSSLPSLPTTLPTSRPSTTITPSQYRFSTQKLSSVERPRSSAKLEPSRLESFINSSQQGGLNQEKISITLPRTGSIEEEDRAKRRVSSDWGHFAEMGLSSPGRNAAGRRGSSK